MSNSTQIAAAMIDSELRRIERASGCEMCTLHEAREIQQRDVIEQMDRQYVLKRKELETERARSNQWKNRFMWAMLSLACLSLAWFTK